MIKFKYIIGANIELAVEANILPAEPEVNYAGGVDILSVKLPNGDDVETDDIFIHNTINIMGMASLDDLLEQEAMERASEECEEN